MIRAPRLRAARAPRRPRPASPAPRVAQGANLKKTWVVGFNALDAVLKGVAPPGISIGMIYRAALPYVWLTMLMMALIFVIPSMVTAFVPS